MTTPLITQSGALREPIDRRDLVYHRQRLRNRLHECIYKTLLERQRRNGITRADLAIRLGKDRGQISRWLSGPSNWTIDTLSDLLLALDAELDPSTCLFEEKPIVNYTHPLMRESKEPAGEVWMASSGGGHLTHSLLPPRPQARSATARQTPPVGS